MALFQGDVIIRSCIQLAIDDLKKEPWLITDIFSDFIENPILKQKYGMKEIERAQEWIKNNKINYYMKHRIDNEEFPAITISMGNSDEDKSLATLGDNSICIDELDPCDIGKPIAFIVKPFNIVSYDQSTGIVELPANTIGYQYVGAGMLAVDPKTGNGWIISGKAGTNGFSIAAGTELNINQLAVVPQYQAYRARRERIISQEQYNIGCHAHGDPANLLFLFYLVKYALLRYREGLLEYNNFQLSNLSCTDMIKNDAFNADNVYSRYIILSGQVEESWVKTPFRNWEAIDFTTSSGDGGGDVDSEADAAENLSNTGIKICSNKDTLVDSDEAENDLWVTIDSTE